MPITICKEKISFCQYDGPKHQVETQSIDSKGQPYTIIAVYEYIGQKGPRYIYKLVEINVADLDEDA